MEGGGYIDAMGRMLPPSQSMYRMPAANSALNANPGWDGAKPWASGGPGGGFGVPVPAPPQKVDVDTTTNVRVSVEPSPLLLAGESAAFRMAAAAMTVGVLGVVHEIVRIRRLCDVASPLRLPAGAVPPHLLFARN